MATVNKVIIASADDAKAAGDDTGLGITHTAINVRADTTLADRRNVGLRFQSIAIPQGAMIAKAYIEVYVQLVASDDAKLAMYGHAIDDSDNFTVDATIAARARTTASVDWIEDGVAAGGIGWYGSNYDIKALIQEIVIRPGWIYKKNMTILLIGKDDPTKDFYFYAWDEDVHQFAPKLHVEWKQPRPAGMAVGTTLIF